MVRTRNTASTIPAPTADTRPLRELIDERSDLEQRQQDFAWERAQLSLKWAHTRDEGSWRRIVEIDGACQGIASQIMSLTTAITSLQNEQRHAASPAERFKRAYLHDRERYARCFRVALVAAYEPIARHCAFLDKECRVDELKCYVGGVPGSKIYAGIRGMVRQRASEITHEHDYRERLERDQRILPENVPALKLMMEATSWCTDDLVAYVGDVAMPAEVKALLDQFDAGQLVERDLTGAVLPANAGHR